jgi:tetratricopeptide (TPR) repeat protein
MSHRAWLKNLDPRIAELREKADAGGREETLALANALNLRCRYRETLEVIEPWLEKHRSDGEAWFERIVTDYDGGANADDLGKMHTEMEGLRDENPDEAVHRRNLGFVRILQQRLGDAERALRQALDRDGQDYRTLALMGLLNLRREQPAEARAWLLKALSIRPGAPRTLRLLGTACEDMGDLAQAESNYAAAVEEHDCYFWGWHSLGELTIRQGDYELGMRCVHRARCLKSNEPESYFILSEIFAEQGHMELAQAEMHRLLLLSPEERVQGLAYSTLGEYMLDLGDRDGAMSYFTLASNMDQHGPGPWVALGDIAMEEEKWGVALNCYREALERDGGNAGVMTQIGYVLMEEEPGGQLEQAEKVFLNALSIDPDEYSAYLGLSECYRLAKRTADQVAMVRQAMEIAPDDPDVWNAHGVACEVEGMLVEATDAYAKALELSPYHRKAANNLGFALEKRMAQGETDLHASAVHAWKHRLLICRDEGQSQKMATEHLLALGAKEADVQKWLETEGVLEI